MRKIYTILFAVLLTANVFAQAPEKMSYQAVIRNSSDQLVTNQQVGMQISILQNTTPVYVETQTTTTNSNGLVTLEIGTGTTTDDFSAINWANSTYFIKTETDPTGGTNYTITGTSQLLSVPYALHAKIAESINGTITETDPAFIAWDKSTGISITESQISDLDHFTTTDETDPSFTAWDKSTGISITESQISDLDHFTTTDETDPVYTASQAVNITATHITNLGNLSGTNTGDQDGSETKVTAGTNVTVTGAGTIASPYVINAVVSLTQAQRDALNVAEGLIVYNTTTHKPNFYNGTEWMNYDGTTAETPPPLSIGDSYQGGIIAYIFASGDPCYIAGEIHGLIASPSDQGTLERWNNWSYKITGAIATALCTGNANTNTIVTNQGAGNYAAQLCTDLILGDYSDWFLPSKDELYKLYLNRTEIGGFASGYYWSSTQGSVSDVAWTQSFINGFQGLFDTSNGAHVRAVRAF
jgi:hypothetical protein